MQADVATVLRKGRLHVVPASQLVPGDMVEVAGRITAFAVTTPAQTSPAGGGVVNPT